MYQKKVICLKVLLLFAVLAVHGGLYVSIIYAEENKPVFNEIMSSIDIKKDGYSVWNGWDFIHHDNYRNPSEIPSVPDEDGEYSDWIELFNPGDTPIDLTGYGLSDNLSSPYKWVFPAYSLAPGQYLLVFASGKDRRNSENAFLHTNFKIKATGETLVLTDSYGNIYDEVTTGYIPADISRGRQPDGGSEWVFFTEPTPGNSNTIPGNLFAGSVMFSHSGGFYESGITVALSPDSVGTVIRYTLDGRDPSENSQEYIDPLLIDKTTVIKARAFKAGLLPGHTVTHTYFIHQNSTLPVISLSTDPNGFFSSETGIYQNPDEESWERPVHVEFFEPDGSLGFSINAGTRIQGKYGTTFPQKPLSIFARGIYGCNEIEYQIFPDLPITEFDSFILRNTSSDWSYAFLRDPLIQSLFKELDVDIQSYRPAVVFINGEYWGIHHIREKQNEEYLTSHHGAGPDNVDLLKPYWRVDLPNRSILLEGDYEHYDAMFEYFETHDLSILENYEYIKTQIDLESYIDYMLAEIYCDNMSWLGNNMKCWRPKTPGGKWRWLVFDVDCGFYGHAVRGKTHVYGHNTLAFATDPDGPEPYPAWCTLIFRKLLENQTFRNDFINRFSDCLNTIFHPQRVIQQISEAKKALEPEMTAHIARWSQTEKSIQSLSDWDENVRILVDFAETRVDSVHTYIIDEFNLGGTAHVTLNVSPPGAGTIKLNSLTLDEFPWSGNYFKKVPIKFTATPNPGYRFAGWTGISAGDTLFTEIYLTGDVDVSAAFVHDSGSSHSVVINEINYNSSPDFDTEDWVEFYNTTDSTVDISSWVFMDEVEAHTFVFPENTVVGPDDYIVLCRDKSLFHQLFPDIEKCTGDIGFGLSGRGELVRLYNGRGELVDSLTYDNNSPWPEAADGSGATLSLRSPELDNALPESWAQSEMYGTPGEKNEYIVSVEEADIPNELVFDQNYPNPFNPETTIEFTLPVESFVELSIYSIIGQKVRTLISRPITAGRHSVRWDGKNEQGQPVSSGVYIARITMGDKIAARSMMLVK